MSFKRFLLGLLGFFVVVGPFYGIGEGSSFQWVFQQPTYLAEKDESGLTSYTCDGEKETCKVNFDFTSSVPTEESSTHYECIIDFGFGITGEENKCNPGMVEFPVGDWDVHLVVKRIADEEVVSEGTITIHHADDTIDPLRTTFVREWQSPSYILEKEDTALTEYLCDPEQGECKINLKVTPLLDGGETSQLTCEIVTDLELVSTSDPCNPNTSIVQKGEHNVIINIFDKARNVILQTETIVLRNPEKEKIDPTRVTMDITWQQPTYLLEKDESLKNEYTCDPSKDVCKINFLITPKIDGVESSQLSCIVKTDFGIEENDCNPSTIEVPRGPHVLMLEIYEKSTNELLVTKNINIQGLPISVGGGGGSGAGIVVLDLTKSRIIVQSGLDEGYVCKTDICQVNFDTEVPSGAECEWDFGGGVFETVDTDKKCNPGYVKFPQNAEVGLKVVDKNNVTNYFEKTISVRRKIEKNVDETLVARIDLQSQITANKRLTDTGIICALGRGEKCSLNFTGESSIGAKSWSWNFGDGAVSDRKNPGSHGFQKGEYQVSLTIMDGIRSSTVAYSVKVVGDFEKELCTDCEKLRGKLQISAVLPNPPHADTVEWIEIRNVSSENISLDSCEIADDSKTYKMGGILGSTKVLRLRQAMTGITLGNSYDVLRLNCGGFEIDSLSWDFPVPTSYIIRREVLLGVPEQAEIVRVIDGDTVDAIISGVKTRIRLLGIDTPETVHPLKPVEKFGKEASDFTRKTLEGKTVWLTFDADPVDHYGRSLAYIWQCPDNFSEIACMLFNAQVVVQGYGRMERRFPFRFYEQFDGYEKEAKNAKRGIWGDADVTKAMNELAIIEKDELLQEQEKEYLRLQKEILDECLEGDLEECDPEKISWSKITEKLSTLNASLKKSGVITISGRTWGDYPIQIEIISGEKIIETFSLQSDSGGNYEISWIPLVPGEYVFRIIVRKDEENITKEKKIQVEEISSHFNEPFIAEIILQGAITDNRWREGDTFHCRSRGSCSVNVTAQTNRTDNVNYFWIFPDGSVSDEKNPAAMKLGYGQSEVLLVMSDEITQELLVKTLIIDHRVIPKKAKASTKKSIYTLDIKDVPQDIGGGVGIEGEKTPFQNLLTDIMILFLLGIGIFFGIKRS